MLSRARLKVHPTTILESCENSELPGEDASYSLVLASFVLSYLNDVAGFARQCARVLRADGCLLISDMHPSTAAERGWARSFHIDGAKIEIEAHSRTLTEIISIFRESGFEDSVLIEPSFEEPEKTIFDDAGKLAEYEDLTEVPAIYILKLKKKCPCSPSLFSGPESRASTHQRANERWPRYIGEMESSGLRRGVSAPSATKPMQKSRRSI